MLTPAGAHDASRHAMAEWGLDDALSLVRAGTGVVFRAGQLAVRVADADLGADWVERERQFAQHLAACGFRTVVDAGLPAVAHPQGLVSAWRWIDHDPASAVDLGSVATQAHTLHQLPVGAVGTIDPMRKIRLWAEVAATHQLADAALLDAARQLAAELDGAFAAVLEQVPLVLVHGDLNAGNVLDTSAGPTLIDLEDGGQGPLQWDLMAQMTAARYYGSAPDTLHEMAARFGTLAAGPVFDVCVQVRTLSSALWTTTGQLRDPDAFTRDEADVRLRTAVDGTAPRLWFRI